MQKVVVIGGGTGLSTLLRGLKLFPLDITAIVSVADDGSSTGVLRKEFDIPAVGDIRNVLVALSETEPIVSELLQYRFNTSSDLNNHAMGNLLLTALYNITGNLTQSLEALSGIFKLKGRILPFSEDKPILVAHLSDGRVIEGESNIPEAHGKISYVSYKNKVSATDEVLKALEDADLIIFAIGSLYTSVIPNLIDKNVRKVLQKSSAKKMYVCNIMTQPGETDGYMVSDFVKAINKHVGKDFIDVVVANNKKIPENILARYKNEGSEEVILDKENLKQMKVKYIKEDLASIENEKVKHDYLKTALAIFTYLTKEG